MQSAKTFASFEIRTVVGGLRYVEANPVRFVVAYISCCIPKTRERVSALKLPIAELCSLMVEIETSPNHIQRKGCRSLT